MAQIKHTILFLLIAFSSCGSAIEYVEEDNIITYEQKYDADSKTIYYLTYVPHQDDTGKLLKLNLAMTIDSGGETVLDFAKRMNNPLLAINASQGLPDLPAGRVQSAGIQIVNKEIIQDVVYKKYAHTLGIKENNELTYFVPGTRAKEMLDAGVNNALCGFVPLIVDFEPVTKETLNILGGIEEAHPRQIIAQFENLDLLILSCGGRGYDGVGMSGSDVIRILKQEKRAVKFAFMLDGGGSVTTVINGKVITKRIDSNGTALRPRGNFLYIQKN